MARGIIHAVAARDSRFAEMTSGFQTDMDATKAHEANGTGSMSPRFVRPGNDDACRTVRGFVVSCPGIRVR